MLDRGYANFEALRTREVCRNYLLLKSYAVCKRSDRIERASAGIAERFITVLLPNYKHRRTQVSCPTLRERCRPIRIGEVFAVILD
jgi:hypothetical protein